MIFYDLSVEFKAFTSIDIDFFNLFIVVVPKPMMCFKLNLVPIYKQLPLPFRVCLFFVLCHFYLAHFTDCMKFDLLARKNQLGNDGKL